MKRILLLVLVPVVLVSSAVGQQRMGSIMSFSIKPLGKTLKILTLVLVSCVAGAKAQDAREVARKVLPSVVVIKVYDRLGEQVGIGSGFLIKKSVVATNFHVIRGASSATVTLVGSTTPLKVEGAVGIDELRDLALLKLEKDAGDPLLLAEISELEIGEDIYVFGNPRGLEGSISNGIVSSKGTRTIEGEELIQITASISPGSSGGPVVNRQGQVIGVASASLRGGQNLNFAVPAPFLSLLLANMGGVIPIAGLPDPATGNGPLDVPAGWKRFTVDHRFSVLMPGEPTEQTLTSASKHGPYTAHLFMLRTSTLVYLLGWVDYDPAFNFDIKKELEANRDKFVKGVKAKVIDSTTIVSGTYLGLEFTARKTGQFFKSKVFVVGRRPYQLIVAFPEKDASAPDLIRNADRFFSSFRVAENQ